MRENRVLCSLVVLVLFLVLHGVNGDNPYRFITWKITYGDIYPLGVKQQGILINGLFPGPHIDAITNDNLIISVYNYLREPFLISWNGLQQRRNSWQDGVYGTTCPIPPGKNFTYVLQAKDQIGSYFYFPSLGLHKAAGAYGSIRIWSRPKIPCAFPHLLLMISLYSLETGTRQTIIRYLDAGRKLPNPDGLLINGRGWNGNTFTVDPGRTYRFRISNVGIATSINFRIQGHKMKLVEVEGSHTLQNTYAALDIHLGQSYSVLVTADQPAKDYYIVVSSRFTTPVLTTTSILHYSNSRIGVSGPIPRGPTTQIDWSLNQARSIRWNLTASGPRPNPQGSYHYGMIKISRTITLANSAPFINGKQRYAINTCPAVPIGEMHIFRPQFMSANFREFVEIIFQNWEDTVQSYHIDGYSFFVVGMDGGQWTPASRTRYNLRDTVARCTTQVYPRSWTAIYMALDNVGMWNIRSENWSRQYLGQQFYLRVYSSANSWRDELPIPKNALLCGRARGRHTRPF
ncbi:hypothetical protein Patl1_09996 [Pistacia atlantica]|uniref:Uncharacterized protein n=1 Tax=Pistacia atlantica TaxID=434234 RepID=A0ACC1A4G7_9ROSI|nr:hypothetical protein Patl1_09996 [Pistacia atlantica]